MQSGTKWWKRHQVGVTDFSFISNWQISLMSVVLFTENDGFLSTLANSPPRQITEVRFDFADELKIGDVRYKHLTKTRIKISIINIIIKLDWFLFFSFFVSWQEWAVLSIIRQTDHKVTTKLLDVTWRTFKLRIKFNHFCFWWKMNVNSKAIIFCSTSNLHLLLQKDQWFYDKKMHWKNSIHLVQNNRRLSKLRDCLR